MVSGHPTSCWGEAVRMQIMRDDDATSPDDVATKNLDPKNPARKKLDPNDPALADTEMDRGVLAKTLTAATSKGDRKVAETPPAGNARYERRELLGKGGMGVVSLAMDLQFSREVAVKEIRGDLKAARHQDRFATECLVTGNLEHPGIPAVYERGVHAGKPFYAMRLVHGQSMKEALSRAQTLDERLSFVSALTRIAQTLAYAHSHGVIHRDIKPSNIVLGDYGETFVLDWGIAKVRGIAESTATGSEGSTGSTETMAGTVIGTPSYMAPEQAAGRISATDERSDVFAIGALLYHILTGRPPYTASSSEKLVAKARSCAYESIHTAAPKAPRGLRLICERAMAKNNVDRFATAGELASVLERFAAQAVAHQDSGPVGWIARVVTALSAILALGAVAVFVALLPRFQQFGLGAYPITAFAALGLTLSVLEFATSGRYQLGNLILAMAGATFLAGILTVAIGFDKVLESVLLPEVFDKPDLYRGYVTAGAREVIGNLTLAAAFAMAQVFAWAVARRRVERA